MRAADLFEQDVTPAQIAREVGVSHQIVSDWRAAWRRSGRDGLRGAGRAGRLPKVSRDQLAQVEVELVKGAEANGYQRSLDLEAGGRGDRARDGRVVSPSARVVPLAPGPEVELAATGTLRHRAQRRSHPALGEEALAATEKRARRQNALIVFEDESGVSLLPSVRATWAPRGHIPVLRHRFVWKRLSLAGALVYEPDGSGAHLFFELRPGVYNDERLIEFLSDLHAVEQRPMVLIWDGLPSHRSRRMGDWIASQRHWFSVEPLPGYAPDLNPIERVWGNLKSTELANLCSDTIGEVADIAEDGLDRIGSDATLCLAFLRHSGLRL